MRRKLQITGIGNYDKVIRRFNQSRTPVTALWLVRYIQAEKERASTRTAKMCKFAFLKSLSVMRGRTTRQMIDAVRAVKVPVPKTIVRPEDVLSREELEMFIKKSPRKWALLWLFVYWTGWRISAILQLELRACHPDAANGVVVCYGVGKASRNIDAELPIRLFGAIRSKWQGRRYVFERAPGVPLSYSQVQKKVKLLGTRILRRRVWNHLFRHTLATNLIEGGAMLHDVSKLLHHSHVSITTDIYVHVKPNRDRIRKIMGRRADLMRAAGVDPKETIINEKPQSRLIGQRGTQKKPSLSVERESLSPQTSTAIEAHRAWSKTLGKRGA